MFIKLPPMKSEHRQHTCEFHKRNPGKAFAGCTCFGSCSAVVKPIEEWTEEEKKYYFGFN